MKSAPRMPSPSRLPCVGDEAKAAFASGWWHGKVVGFCLGLGAAVLLGWLR